MAPYRHREKALLEVREQKTKKNPRLNERGQEQKKWNKLIEENWTHGPDGLNIFYIGNCSWLINHVCCTSTHKCRFRWRKRNLFLKTTSKHQKEIQANVWSLCYWSHICILSSSIFPRSKYLYGSSISSYSKTFERKFLRVFSTKSSRCKGSKAAVRWLERM